MPSCARTLLKRTFPKEFCKHLLRPTPVAVRPAAALLAFVWISAAAQNQARTTWDGIYSDAQATRGAALYKENCQSCHGDTLDGLGPVPPLAGSDFTSHWDGMAVADLLDKMQTSMPADRPGQLSAQVNADILSYILQYNKFPSGAADLPSDASLKNIRFMAERFKK
jgi:S-disulfanyl-L-cysteine oxidoreductase SoxD